MSRRILFFIAILIPMFSLTGCEPRETLAEVDFENSKFGLEYIPDPSLEGYNEKYHPFFQPAGSSNRKYLLNGDDGFMFHSFPKNVALLKGIEVVVLDTVPRTYEKYDRTVALTTLYVDPKMIDRSSWQTFSNFMSRSYSRPDSTNEVLDWMNRKYNLGGNPDSVYVFETIYALVYSDLDALEPQYKSSDGKRLLKVGVDDGIYFRDGNEEAPAWGYTGRLTDSVFYFWPGREELMTEFGEYERDAMKFKELYSTTAKEN